MIGIAAYTYQADYVCPDCIVDEVLHDNQIHDFEVAGYNTIGATLEAIAKMVNIDYDDQRSYDSDDFPKPVLALDLDDGHYFCGVCGDPIT